MRRASGALLPRLDTSSFRTIRRTAYGGGAGGVAAPPPSAPWTQRTAKELGLRRGFGTGNRKSATLVPLSDPFVFQRLAMTHPHTAAAAFRLAGSQCGLAGQRRKPSRRTARLAIVRPIRSLLRQDLLRRPPPHRLLRLGMSRLPGRPRRHRAGSAPSAGPEPTA